MAEILVIREGEEGRGLEIGPGPVYVGRAHTNDLIVVDDRVSSHHAVFWAERGRVWVEDLGSRNGTWIGGQRLAAPAAIPDGSDVWLGPNLALRVRGPVDPAAGVDTSGLMLEDVAAGVRFPLWSDRFTIGSHPDSDLRLPEGPARAATLLVYDGGEVWVGVGSDDRPIDVDQEFEVAGQKLCLRAVRGPARRTAGVEADRYPYHLDATLNGVSGPEATVEDPSAHVQYRVEADNRAVLLFLLGRRVIEDRKAGRPRTELGWCPDVEVARGIWGRTRTAEDANSLNVLVHRVRRELGGAGFDPWFIEKRRRRIRVRVAEVTLR